MLAILISTQLQAGTGIKLKGVVVAFDTKTLTFVQGTEKYVLSNEVIKYRSIVSWCDQEIAITHKDIIKKEILKNPSNPYCKKEATYQRPR